MGNAIRMTRSRSGVYQVPFTLDAPWVRETGRLAARAAMVLAFVYAAAVAWGVIQDLRAVKLYEFRQVLRIVSVGDAILVWFAYALAREFIRALGRRPHRDEMT